MKPWPANSEIGEINAGFERGVLQRFPYAPLFSTGMLYKFTQIRRMLRTISRFGSRGSRLARFIYWHGIRRYQEHAYALNAGTPFVAVTTRIGCKNCCEFCPQDTFIRAYKKRLSDFHPGLDPQPEEMLLSLDTFKRLLGRIPKNFAINFAGFSEPWLAPDCTDMVLAAHARGHRIRVLTTLVGMGPADVMKLTGMPFELFSVHAADEGPTTRIPMDETMMNTLRAVEKRGFSQLEFHNHSGRPHPNFVKVFGRFEIRTAGVVDRAGNLAREGKMPEPKRISGRIRCGFNPQSTKLANNILLPNGDVVLCCEDYGLKHVLGNLNSADLLSLYEAEPYRTIKRGLDDESIDLLCRYCHRAVQVQESGKRVIAIS